MCVCACVYTSYIYMCVCLHIYLYVYVYAYVYTHDILYLYRIYQRPEWNLEPPSLLSTVQTHIRDENPRTSDWKSLVNLSVSKKSVHLGQYPNVALMSNNAEVILAAQFLNIPSVESEKPLGHHKKTTLLLCTSWECGTDGPAVGP